MSRDWGAILERTTPRVLGGLGALFLCMTVFVHLDPGRSPAARHPSPLALAGRQQWMQHGCATCHQVYGLGGYLGPDLTNVHSRRDEEFIRFVLTNGYGTMPRMKLSQQAVSELMAYLAYLDTTGEYPPKHWPTEGLPN